MVHSQESLERKQQLKQVLKCNVLPQSNLIPAIFDHQLAADRLSQQNHETKCSSQKWDVRQSLDYHVL